MSPDRLRQMVSVLEMALELDPETRAQYLATLAIQDPELVEEARRHCRSSDEATTASQDSATVSPTYPLQPGVQKSRGLRQDSGPRSNLDTAGPSDSSTIDPTAPPEHIGPYRIMEWLGAGGMGAVYAAERADQEFTRRVAIKLLRIPFPSDEMVQRFRSERQILATFDHPNIARLYEGGTTQEGLPYIAMELIEGAPVPVYCDEHQLSIKRRVELFRKICSAVRYAHSRLVVHRDLKPSNVLVTKEGEPKLLDFGIAKLLDPGSFPLTVEATATGASPFTPHYASPEQLSGEAISTASDVYSLGVLLYLLLSGDLPFRPSSPFPAAILELMRSTTPTLPSRAVSLAEAHQGSPASERFGEETQNISRQIAGDLDNIVAKALEIDPSRRYQSVEQLDEDLWRHLSGQPVSAREGAPLYRAEKFVRRHKAGVGAVIGFVGMSGAFAATMARQTARIAEERNAALRSKEKALQAQRQAEIAQAASEEAAEAEREVSRILVELFENEDPEAANPEVSAVSLVELGVERVLARPSLAPRSRIKLLNTLGLVLRNLGEYPRAIEVLKKVSVLAESRPPKEVMEVQINLARAYESAGDLEKATDALQAALALAEAAGDEPQLAAIFNLQGVIAYYQGRPSLASDHYREAQRLYEKSFGPSSLEALTPRINAASIADQQDPGGAIQELLEILGSIHHEISSNSCMAMRNLGYLLVRANFRKQAAIALRRSVILAKDHYGNLHKKTLRPWLVLIHVLILLRQYDRAQSLLDAFDISPAPEHLQPALKGELGRCYGLLFFEQGHFREAIEHFRPLLKNELKLLTSHPSERIQVYALAAWAYLEIHEVEAAQALLFEISSKTYESDPQTEILREAVEGRFFEQKQELDGAQRCYLKALTLAAEESFCVLGTPAAERCIQLMESTGNKEGVRVAERLQAQHLAPRCSIRFPNWFLADDPSKDWEKIGL